MTDEARNEVLALEFLSVSRERLRVSRSRIDACLERLSEDQLWLRQHEVENAVANLVLHLCGAVTQWLLGGVGGQSISRDRDQEFSRREPMPRQELIGALERVMVKADDVLARVTVDELLQVRTIQGCEVTGLQAVNVAVAHFTEHTGQIIWVTKRMTGEDLGLHAPPQRGVHVLPRATS